jgi:tyrosyl-tRNA synthetase
MLLRRFIRTAEIMGRQESLDNLTGAMIIYSCMQTADIFYLGAKICQLGMDQRKVNMLAREIGPILGFWKPVVVSHHMLMGLKPPSVTTRPGVSFQNRLERTIALKMSKSIPDSAIFMTDTTEDIKRKINKAYCPEGVVEDNPILEYYKYIVFESLDRLGVDKIVISRPQKFGGDISFSNYEELEKKFANKEIHPADLKASLVSYLDQLIEPVRKHFEENKEAKELLEKVRSFKVTR